KQRAIPAKNLSRIGPSLSGTKLDWFFRPAAELQLLRRKIRKFVSKGLSIKGLIWTSRRPAESALSSEYFKPQQFSGNSHWEIGQPRASHQIFVYGCSLVRRVAEFFFLSNSFIRAVWLVFSYRNSPPCNKQH